MKKVEELKSAAKAAQKNAYAPYSNFHVGAAILTRDELIFRGCNFENLSFGATICAERTAIGTAIAETAVSPPVKGWITALAVFTYAETVTPPCGLCLQVLSEFCLPSCEVFLFNEKGEQKSCQFADLFPIPFESLD